MRTGEPIPKVNFYLRKENPNFIGIDKMDWHIVDSEDFFKDRRCIVVGLPGPFTPVCSSFQVPQFEKYYNDFRFEYNFDEIYVTSVTDYFVLEAWKEKLGLKNLKMLPDGNGTWARLLGMYVNREEFGFGLRSWRYAMIINDNVIERMFAEPRPEDKLGNDPYGESSPQNILEWLRRKKKGEDLKEEWLYPGNVTNDRVLGEENDSNYREFSNAESTIDK